MAEMNNQVNRIVDSGKVVFLTVRVEAQISKGKRLE